MWGWEWEWQSYNESDGGIRISKSSIKPETRIYKRAKHIKEGIFRLEWQNQNREQHIFSLFSRPQSSSGFHISFFLMRYKSKNNLTLRQDKTPLHPMYEFLHLWALCWFFLDFSWYCRPPAPPTIVDASSAPQRWRFFGCGSCHSNFLSPWIIIWKMISRSINVGSG